MATKKLLSRNKQSGEQGSKSLLSSLGFNEISKPVPDSYKLGRDSTLQLAKIERNLFTDMEERDSGNYIVSGLNKKVTELDFTAFSFAVGQILYNQSYQSGNVETNSGISKTISRKMSKTFEEQAYTGDIVTSLNDLCRLAYGVEAPDQRQRKTMSTLIDVIHSTPVTIQTPKGAKIESILCACMEKYTAEDGAISYNLHLHPIFCHGVANNFAELPQDLTKRLSGATKKKTLSHYRLIRLLSNQDKRKPFVRTIAQLLADLALDEAYNKDRGRTEKQILSVIDSMKDIELLSSYDIEYMTIRNKKAIGKITFHLNRDFIRHTQEPEAKE